MSGQIMTFPNSVEEFMESYKMVDTEHIYSNGTEYVPIYRMKQWFEHLDNADVDKNGGVSRYIDFYLIGELVDSHGNVHYEDLKNLPTADVPQWIPCSEEQPTYDGDFLVTLDFEWGKEIEMGEWFCGEWINQNSHVTVAWMPLPQPWGERREDGGSNG